MLVCRHGGQLLKPSSFVPYACTRLNASRISSMRLHRTPLYLQRVTLGIGSTPWSTTRELPRVKPSFLMFFVTVQTCVNLRSRLSWVPPSMSVSLHHLHRAIFRCQVYQPPFHTPIYHYHALSSTK